MKPFIHMFYIYMWHFESLALKHSCTTPPSAALTNCPDVATTMRLFRYARQYMSVHTSLDYYYQIMLL